MPASSLLRWWPIALAVTCFVACDGEAGGASPTNSGGSSAGGVDGGSGATPAGSGGIGSGGTSDEGKSGGGLGGSFAGGAAPGTGGSIAERFSMGGVAGEFTAENLSVSCRYEDCPGCVQACRESYNSPSDGTTCLNGLNQRTNYVLSTDPCPLENVVGVCVLPETSRIHYSYDGYFDQRSSLELCESLDGWFYGPESFD